MLSIQGRQDFLCAPFVVVLCPAECLLSLALSVQIRNPVEWRELDTCVVLGNVLSINVAGQLEVTVQVVLSWCKGHSMLRSQGGYMAGSLQTDD
jgi:hypothetical protein